MYIENRKEIRTMLKQVNTNLSEEVLTYIKEMAEKENRSLSSMIQMIIIKDMMNNPDYDEVKNEWTK